MKTITKKQIIKLISNENGLDSKSVQLIIQELFSEIIESLRNGDRFEFREFGIFETVVRKKKIGRNPKKPGVSIVIPETRIAKFTPSQKMKALVINNDFQKSADQ